MRRSILAFLAASAPAFAHGAGPEAAETLRFLVCQPGGPELEQNEQAVIRDFYRYVGRKLEMKEGAITGDYFNRRSDCVAALEKEPQVLMLSLDLFLEKRKELKLEPVAQVDMESGTTGRFRVMVANTGPPTLAELRGKPITGTHLDEPRFVARVILGGKLGTPNELVLKPEALGLRAVRNVIRGKAAAVILDDAQYRALKGTQFEKQLRQVFESEPLPNPPVAVAAARVPPGLIERVGKILMEMNSDAHGQALVKTFGLKGFAKPTDGAWDRIDAILNSGR